MSENFTEMARSRKASPMQKALGTETKQSLASRGFGNAYLLLALTMLFWAGNSVVARGTYEIVPPMALAWLRWTLAALLILPLAWPHLKRDAATIRAHWPILLLLGSLGTGTFVSLYYFGLSKTSAINGLIINSTVPILIPIAAFAIYREKLSRSQAAGIALSFVGVIAIFAKGDAAILAKLELTDGDLWVLAAMLIWAVYTSLLREQPRMHWLSFGAVSFAVASIINFPLFLTEHFIFEKQIQPTIGALLAIGYVATLPSLVSQIFYIRGVELIGGNRAGIFLHLVPLFGTVLAMIFLGETLHPYHLAGFSLILAGVWIGSRPERSLKIRLP